MNQFIKLSKMCFNFDKKNPTCWIIRIFLIIFIIILLYFFIKLVPYLIGITFLIYLFGGDSIQNFFQKSVPNNYEYEYITVRNALFIALQECSDLLGGYRPVDISKLIPPNLQCIRYIANCPCNHFVLLKKEPDKQLNYADSIHVLQDVIIQHLISFNIPDIPFTYYDNLPTLYVVNMGDDLENPNYIYIDIIYNNSKQTSIFIQEKEHRLFNSAVPSNPVQIKDKDF